MKQGLLAGCRRMLLLALCAALLLPTLPAYAATASQLNVSFQVTVHAGRARTALSLMNKLRKENGLPDLVMLADLEKVAIQRAAEVFVFFDHDRPNVSSYTTAYAGYSSLKGSLLNGESISAGFSSAKSVMEEWQSSPEHLDNILDKDFTHVGVACVQVSGSYNGHYWVLYFQQQPEGIAATKAAASAGSTGTKRTMKVDIAKGMFARADKSHGKFELRVSNVNMKDKRTAQPSIYLYDKYGVKIGKCDPAYGFTYTSSNKNVFTVLKNGTLTRKKAGTATLSVKVTGLDAAKATVTVGGSSSASGSSGNAYANRTAITAATIGDIAPSLKATAYTAHVTLSTYVKGASGYVLYRSTTKNGTYRKVDEKATTQRWNLKLEKEDKTTTYYYKVRAYKNSGGKKVYSGYSTAVKAVH